MPDDMSELDEVLGASDATTAVEQAPENDSPAKTGTDNALPQPETGADSGTIKLIMVAFGGLLGMGVLIAVLVILSGGSAPSIKRHELPAGGGVSQTVEDELEGFMDTTLAKTAAMDNALQQLAERMNTLEETVAHQDKLRQQFLEDLVGRLNGTINTRFEAIEKNLNIITDEQDVIIPVGDSRVQAVMDQLANGLAVGGNNTFELRAKAAESLKKLGLTDREIAAIVTRASNQAGIFDVGDIAEEPPTQAELDAVPAWMRPFIESGRDYTVNITSINRLVAPTTVKRRLQMFLRSKVGGRSYEEKDLDAFYDVVRVRRDNIPQSWEPHILPLIKMREESGIATEDADGIAKLVYANRGKLIPGPRPVMKPGQLVAMVHLVGRTIAGADSSSKRPGSKPAYGPATAAHRQILGTRQHQAMTNAWQLGRREPKDIAMAAMAATRTYLDTARVSLATAEQAAMIQEAVGTFLADKMAAEQTARRSLPPPRPQARTVVRPQQEGTAGKLPTATNTEPTVRISGMLLSRQAVANLIAFMTPEVLDAAGIRPGSDEAIAAQIVLWEQNPRLTDGIFPVASKAPEPLAVIREQLWPSLVKIAQAGASLTGLEQFPTSFTKDPDDRSALLAYIAAKVGAHIHEHERAASIVNDIDTALRSANAPDLTQARRAYVSARDAMLQEAAP